MECFLVATNDLVDAVGDHFRVAYIDDISMVTAVDREGANDGGEIKVNEATTALEALSGAVNELEMKLNQSKTALMVFDIAKRGRVENNFVAFAEDGSKILESRATKLLGVTLTKYNLLSEHVTVQVQKARKRLWILRHLRNMGADISVLVRVYTSFIRPVFEYCAPALFPLFNQCDVAKMDSVQKIALKIIYGFENDYDDLLERAQEGRIECRLKELTENFAKKESWRRQWFPRTQKQTDAMMTRAGGARLRESTARTEMRARSPLFHMRKYLNKSL